MKHIRRQWRKFLFNKVLHADDTPHDIAMGVGVATFVAFLPLVGLQTVISLAVAAAIRANKAVCIPIVWITNPVTMGPIYGGCLVVGGWITGQNHSPTHEATLLALSRHEGFRRFLEPTFWGDLFRLLASLGADLWVGCFVVGTILAILGYVLTRWGLGVYRERRRHHRLQRELFRVQRRAAKLTRTRDPA